MKGRVTLMHKNDKVASCYFGKGQTLTQIYTVYDEALLPVVAQKDTLKNLQLWVQGRFTAKKRDDFAPHRDFYKFDVKNLSSAMDGYWIKEEKGETWKDVNPYDNFENSKDEVELLVFTPNKLKNDILEWNSPNLTVPFEAENFLLREGDKFYLLMGSPKRRMDQYKIGESMGISLAKREYVVYQDKLFAKIELSVSENVEYIPFEEYYLLFDKPKGCGHFEKIKECCKHFAVPDYEKFLNDLLRFIKEANISNWKLSDIGILRDANTLKILGFHPLI